jgi:hypothetical protein
MTHLGIGQSGFSVPATRLRESEERPSNPGERLELELPPYAHRVANRSRKVVHEPRWIGIHVGGLPPAPASGSERDPSPEEIRERTHRIRAEWSEQTRRQRCGHRPHRPWSVPVTHAAPPGYLD